MLYIINYGCRYVCHAVLHMNMTEHARSSRKFEFFIILYYIHVCSVCTRRYTCAHKCIRIICTCYSNDYVQKMKKQIGGNFWKFNTLLPLRNNKCTCVCTYMGTCCQTKLNRETRVQCHSYCRHIRAKCESLQWLSSSLTTMMSVDLICSS